MARSTHPDVLAAVVFASTGGIGVAASRGLEPGTLMRMGPGYLPTVVGVLLLLLSTALALRAVMTRGLSHGRAGDGEGPVTWRLGPILAILAALGVFAALIDPVGLVGATLALVAAARLAERPLRPVETAVLAVAAAAFSALVFVELLQLPIALWPA
jgi:hypothetical protein